MMHTVLVVYLFLLAAGYSSNVPALPSQTVFFDDQWAIDGASPWPTSLPGRYDLRRALEARQATVTQTCGYSGPSSIVCPASQYCAYNTAGGGYVGCCSLNALGSLTTPCWYNIACVNQAESRSLCGTGACGLYTGICGFTSSTGTQTFSAYPYCRTEIVTIETFEYTNYGCATAPGSTLFYSEYLIQNSGTLSKSVLPVATPSTTTTSTPLTSTTSTTSTTPTTSTTSTTLTTSTPGTTIPVTTTPSPTPTLTPQHHSNTAAIAGGVVGGVAGLAIIAGITGFILYRINKKKKEAAYSGGPEMTGTRINVNPK